MDTEVIWDGDMPFPTAEVFRRYAERFPNTPGASAIFESFSPEFELMMATLSHLFLLAVSAQILGWLISGGFHA